MDGQIASPLEWMADAWHRLTGGELSLADAGSLPPEVRASLGEAPSAEPILAEAYDQWWWIVPMRRSHGGLLVARAQRDGPWKALVASWAGILDRLLEEQAVSSSLSEELLRAWDRLTFLFEILQSLGESRNLQDVLDKIAATLGYLFRARAVVLEVKVGDRAMCSASGAPVPSIPAAAHEQALAVGRPVVLDLPAEPGVSTARRLVLSPLRARSGLTGWIAFLDPPSESLDAGDLQLLGSLAEYVAVFLEAAHMRETRAEQARITRELEMAAEIQRSLLPSRLPQVEGLSVHAFLRPARLAGGDFYDVAWGKDGSPFILLADVSGKGMPAALLTAIVHTAFHELAPQHDNPAQLMNALNRALYQDLDRAHAFVTVALAHPRADGQAIAYTSSGHVQALLRRASGELDQVSAHGLPLGILADESYQSSQVALGPGDLLLLCSDGFIEVLNETGRPFGVGRLLDIMDIAYQAGPDELVQMLVAGVETYAAELPLADDLALILISGSPVSQPAHPVWPFVCPGQIGALRPVYAEALKWMFEHARSWAQRQEMEEFLFAVWEVMKNQVSHALQGEADLILGRLAITPDYFEAHLYDRGRAFSEPPLAGKAPTADSSVEGGYGFLIVKGILDDCHYERQAHGRNHWRLEKLRREG